MLFSELDIYVIYHFLVGRVHRFEFSYMIAFSAVIVPKPRQVENLSDFSRVLSCSFVTIIAFIMLNAVTTGNPEPLVPRF